jgi:hypothetical protein
MDTNTTNTAQAVGPDPLGEVLTIVGLDGAFRDDLIGAQARLGEIIELRDGLRGLVNECKVWMDTDPDFEKSHLKMVMALHFLRGCEIKLNEISKKAEVIEGVAKGLLDRFQGSAASAAAAKTKEGEEEKRNG